MLELSFAAGGAVVGALATWLVLARQRAILVADREQRAARLAAAEVLEAELRSRISRWEHDAAGLRAALDDERGARAQADVRRAQAEVREDAARAGLDDQRRLIEQARERLGETFQALSAEALERSGAAFLARAQFALDAQLGERQHAIDGVVKPLQDSLRRYEEQVRTMEAAREHAYGGLEQQLRTVAAGHAELQRETGALVAALRAPHVRGRWGELTLHRVVELAGMTQHCDYKEQVSIDGESGRLRPDMVVHLPAGREIVVDAKVPLSAYLDATTARSPEERTAYLHRYSQQVRQHMTALAGKAYWDEFAKAADFMVMFIPGEAFVAAALEADPSLLEDAMARRVLIATPTTLIAVLRAVACGWREEQLAANAAQISELGRQLYDRLRTLAGHVDDLGGALSRATGSYNRAVASLEARVLPAARRFRELGAATGDDIASLSPVDQHPRGLTAAELTAPFTRSDLPA